MTSGHKWVVVADGGSFRVFSYDRESRTLALVPNGAMARATKRSGEVMADRPGRSFDSHGSGRHAMEPTMPANRVAEKEFLRGLADRLHIDAQKGHFTELVLIAPPRALGELRGLISAQVDRTITTEIAKDLTGETPHELQSRLRDSL